MFAPDDCPRPAPDGLTVWARTDFCGGAWHVVNHHGYILHTLDLWRAARRAREIVAAAKDGDPLALAYLAKSV